MLRLAHFVVRDLLERRDLRGEVFHGGLNSQGAGARCSRRSGSIPEFRVLFSTDAGGLGLNLQEAASIVVNLEVPWNPAVLEQRIGRVHRLGQRRSVQVLHFVTGGAIEERVRQVVESKRALFEGLLSERRGQRRLRRGEPRLVPSARARPDRRHRRQALVVLLDHGPRIDPGGSAHLGDAVSSGKGPLDPERHGSTELRTRTRTPARGGRRSAARSRSTRSTRASASSAVPSPRLTKKFACFGETCRSPTRSPFSPAWSISRPAKSPCGWRKTDPQEGSSVGWFALRDAAN